MLRLTPISGVRLFCTGAGKREGDGFPKHAVNTSVYARLRHPWLRTVSESHPPHARPDSVLKPALPLHPKQKAGEKHSHDGRNQQRDARIPDRSEATASPDDPLSVLEQGNLPS